MVAQKVSKNGVLQFDALEQTLENDLRVIVVPTGLPHLVSLQIPVQTGSRNEIENLVSKIEKIETALESSFQGYFVDAIIFLAAK